MHKIKKPNTSNPMNPPGNYRNHIISNCADFNKQMVGSHGDSYYLIVTITPFMCN